MPNYKDTNNKVHFLDSAEFEYLLPAGCVAITDGEATQLQSDNETKRQAEHEVSLTYQQKRAAEYPASAMYLDAIVKGDIVQQQAYIDACLAVKAKYPKI